jgi:hypothetical protein
MHGRSGHKLAQAVVNVVGHLAPVLLLHLQEAPRQPPQLLRRPLLLADVVEDQHDADDVALRITDGRAAVVDEPPCPVPGDQRRMISQANDEAFPHHLRHRVFRRAPRLLVDDIEDVSQGPAGSLFLAPSGHRLGGGIQEGHATVLIGGDHRVADADEDRGEPLLPLPQRLLRPLALRDVVHGSHPHAAPSVHMVLAANRRPKSRAILPQANRFVWLLRL